METRVCIKCGIEKNIDEFYLKSSKSKIRRRKCKSCCKESVKERFESLSEEEKLRIIKLKRINRKKYKITHKNKILESKSFKDAKMRTKRKNTENGKSQLWERCQYLIRNNGLRPSICPICGKNGNIHAHHPDYSKQYEIIFACGDCHMKIHNGELEIDKDKIIDLEKYYKKKHKEKVMVK